MFREIERTIIEFLDRSGVEAVRATTLSADWIIEIDGIEVNLTNLALVVDTAVRRELTREG